MRQLLVVLAVLATLGVAARFAPAPERILPLEFSKDFPEHREHHEQLLQNLGQKPLRSYPGDVVRLWWVGPNPQKLRIVEPTGITEVTYETDGYKPRVLKQSRTHSEIRTQHWREVERQASNPHVWEMPPGPGNGPFEVGGFTWIVEIKLGQRYRCLEKIDPVPAVFCDVLNSLRCPPDCVCRYSLPDLRFSPYHSTPYRAP